VIAACAAEGLPVKEEPVLASEEDLWAEVFLTNAVRLTRPVREVRWANAEGGGSGPDARESRLVPDAWGSISNRLYRRILASLDDDLGP
jgi:branched-subunit amino acid aminotransferase/4-amino-4-deoxychorismate lyase